MPQIFPLDILTNTVVNLRQELSPGQFSVGTGTFIVHNNISYLWTAEHLAKDMQTNAEFIVRGNNDLPIVLTVEDLTQQVQASHGQFTQKQTWQF